MPFGQKAIVMNAKTSNMKRVIQMALKHNPSDHFDAESRIAGMSATPGFITAFAVASKAGSVEVDQIIGYFGDGHPNHSLVPGQRYAWIMKPEAQGLTKEAIILLRQIERWMSGYGTATQPEMRERIRAYLAANNLQDFEG